MGPIVRLIFISLLISGCQSEGDKKATENKKTNPVVELPVETKEIAYLIERSENLKSDLSNLDIFSDNLNRYVIQVNAQKGLFKGATVQCKTLGEEQKILKSHFDSEGKYALLTVNLDNSNLDPEEFNCTVLDQQHEYSKRFKIKKSLEIDLSTKIENLKYDQFSKLSLDTLIIRRGGALYTSDKSIAISVKDLVGENGKLGTFPAESTAPANTIGRSGGQINLEVKNIYGQISFELRGENGGVQKEIPPKKLDRPMTPSHLNGQCNQDNIENKNGKCVGKKGINGEKGYPGLQGMEGGNSGSLELTVNSMSKAIVSLLYFPGKGGRGGEGGEGQDGGIGGIGSTVKYYDDDVKGGAIGGSGPKNKAFDAENNKKKTVKYPDGPEGDKGDQGDEGEPGYDGAIQTSMVFDIENDLALDLKEDWSNKDMNK